MLRIALVIFYLVLLVAAIGGLTGINPFLYLTRDGRLENKEKRLERRKQRCEEKIKHLTKYKNIQAKELEVIEMEADAETLSIFLDS